MIMEKEKRKKKKSKKIKASSSSSPPQGLDLDHAPSTSIAAKLGQAKSKVAHVCRRIRLSFPRFFRLVFDRILVCSSNLRCLYLHRRGRNNGQRYRRLSRHPTTEEEEEGGAESTDDSVASGRLDSDSDLVPLKISLLGDCQIGKTTFVVKYVGDEQERKSLQMKGLNLIDKTLYVKGATIAFSFWDVGGDSSSLDHLPIACKDAVAIFFMFDLTSRSTLHSVIEWYTQAKRWNQMAIPVLIGTKFDDFVRLPPNLQSTIITQARAYARAMKATLFFSSATHNINVNKILKFITAKLFDLPWTVERNLAVGEPIIDF